MDIIKQKIGKLKNGKFLFITRKIDNYPLIVIDSFSNPL